MKATLEQWSSVVNGGLLKHVLKSLEISTTREWLLLKGNRESDYMAKVLMKLISMMILSQLNH